MKALLALLVLVLVAVYFSSMQNIQEQKGISLAEAIVLAKATANKLATNQEKSSKDGLNKSWRLILKENFTLHEKATRGFIIEGYNKKAQEKLYFYIDKQGHVLEVVSDEYLNSHLNHMR